MTESGDTESGDTVPPWWSEPMDDLMFLDDEDAWALSLARAAKLPVDPPYVKSDEERAQDTEDWRTYTDQVHEDDRRISVRAAAAREAMAGLMRLSRARRRARERFVVYCSAATKPCRLYVAYNWPPPRAAGLGTEDTLLVVASTHAGRRAALPAWSLDMNRLDPQSWLPVGCAHGHGRMPFFVPAKILGARYTARSPRLARRITDLLGASAVQWTPTTPMLTNK